MDGLGDGREVGVGGGRGGLAECLVLLQDSGYRVDIGVDVEEVADGGGAEE